MMENPCPSEKSLRELATGTLHGDEAKAVRAHAVKCPTCSLYLVGSAATAATPALPETCPPEQSLRALAKGQIRGDAAVALRKHAQSCEKCSLYLMGTSETSASPPAEASCPPEKSLHDMAAGHSATMAGPPLLSTSASPPLTPSLSGCPPQQSLNDMVRGSLHPETEKDIRTHAQSCSKCSLYLLNTGETGAGLSPGEICPPEPTLVQLANGQLKGLAAVEIRAHTDKCPKCSVFLSALGDNGGDVAKAHALAESVLSTDQPARYVAEFRLVRALGQGAMGQVFLAHDSFLDRLVAVKFLTAGESTPTARERFFVEARAVARLQHPNVVTLFRAGEENGQRYIASEYVRGQSMERLKKPLPWQKALDIGLGLARGLASAHQRGVLHRDIKPANTMMTETGEVKILDFGLAKLVSSHLESESGRDTSESADGPPVDTQQMSSLALTRTGSLLGTPLYMAPEVWLGKVATARTDVYSLGAMLYELCSGETPHKAETVPALKELILGQDAKPLARLVPRINAKLAAVIDQCLRRDPQERFASGLELRDALTAIAAKVPFLTRRVAAVAAALVVVIVASLGGVGIARDRQAKRQAVLAQRLGEEIKDMEWMLRSARQLPVHDLNREQAIVRKRMAQLKTEMLGYGELGQGLAHYALGRGHLALQEYPQALSQLSEAIALGYQGADAQYALGLVLGLHFQQAKAELNEGGPPSWVKKRLKPLETRYLKPALTALMRSRQMKHDAPQYLEGLISFYQGDYDAALARADAALKSAPWFYEALVLAGDVYVERGQYALAQKSNQESDALFAKAVDSYERAATMGSSDTEVYLKLTNAWLNRRAPALTLGLSPNEIYDETVRATDKALQTDPGSVQARLQRSDAGKLLAMPSVGGNANGAQRLEQCLKGVQSVLSEQPEHYGALLNAGNCYVALAELAVTEGVDVVPMQHKAAALFERVVAHDPNHYNAGLMLSVTYANLVEQLAKRGTQEAKAVAEKGLAVVDKAAKIEEEAYEPLIWGMGIRRYQVLLSTSWPELQQVLANTDADYARIRARNASNSYALHFYMAPYAFAAHRAALAGLAYQPLLKRVLEQIAQLRALGTKLYETDQFALLAHYVEARRLVSERQDPAPILATMEDELQNCLSQIPNDATCLAHSALAHWVDSDWKAQNRQPVLPSLQRALKRALSASQQPERIVAPHLILAETYLRLAGTDEPATEKKQHIVQGLAAVQNAFSIYPDHPQGLGAKGALLLLRANDERDVGTRQATVREALMVLEKAVAKDPLLDRQYVASLDAARAIKLAMSP